MTEDWSPKRQRQYKDIKASEESRGVSERTAEHIAAATVNKQRAESGETKEDLYREAQRLDIHGRSTMSYEELAKAVKGAKE
ncbi:plasmid stabilization protein [Nocardia camponoti]|uniref:Plasmid stabilization protein n=1 Tax=Nocardia camponoti TaxID=1616106 RepID=A0A917VC93_9NOCA|nr:plasmid stabilization protein [Nocardia camponoti]GGK62100.1 hypothetical protein GCM10011591_37960 [Nocardia camponoti]